MTQYPNTEVYYVSFSWGSSGSFITSLVYDLVIGPSGLPFSDNGNAHERAYMCRNNWKSEIDFDNIEQTTGISTYSYVCPKNPEVPLILYGHPFPKYDELFKKFNRCKLIIITINNSDVSRVRLNVHNKLLKKEKSTSIHSIIGVNEDYLDVELPDYDNVFLLPFTDIYQNKNKVLLLLQQITGRKITPAIIKIYDNYLELQKRLYNQ